MNDKGRERSNYESRWLSLYDYPPLVGKPRNGADFYARYYGAIQNSEEFVTSKQKAKQKELEYREDQLEIRESILEEKQKSLGIVKRIADSFIKS